MQLFFEFFPVLLFFLAFKFVDIYFATLVGIISTFVLSVACRIWRGKWDRKQVITLIIFMVFGGMTLYFHDPIFVQWKPTIIFWLFSLVIIGSQIFTKKPLMQRFMENMLDGKASVPQAAWRRLNIVWAIFFALLGALNLYVAYHYSNDAWVNFKFYGITSALFVLSILQAVYLTRYLSEADK